MNRLATIPDEIQSALYQAYGHLIDFRTASGGCINHGGRLETAGAVYFIKWNSVTKFPSMFQAERRGLELLAANQCLCIPEVETVMELDNFQIIVMEQIDQGPGRPDYEAELGRNLACIHHSHAGEYGLDHDNYMGALPQNNERKKRLVDFVIDCRLQPQLSLALKSGRMTTDDEDCFQKLYAKLSGILYEEEPSLIHGDLWNGNVITDANGGPVLIDPAVSFGHREMDLAMTTLFGGFGPAFYNAYKESYPLPPGYKERWDVYNLYPLLIHVNLFGGGYSTQVRSILKEFV